MASIQGWLFSDDAASYINYDFHVTLDEAKIPIEWNYRTKAELQHAGLGFITEMDELNGVSVFLRDDDDILHTYSTYGRGVELLLGTYMWLDLTPLGRQEGWGGTPDRNDQGQEWLRYHDRYSA